MVQTSPRDIAVLLLVIMVILMIGPAVVLGIQALWFLQSGEWTSVTVFDFLHAVGVIAAWLDHPDDWIGPWKILNWMPLSMGTSVLAGILLIMWIKWG